MDALWELVSEISPPPAIAKQERRDPLVRIERGECVFIEPFRYTTLDYPILKILDEAGVCQTNVERIREILRQMSDQHFEKYLDELDKTLRKHESIGNLFLTRSTSLYNPSSLNLALHCNNLGLMFIPAESPNVAKLYANRARILFKLKDYKECINEAVAALGILKNSPFQSSLTMKLRRLKRTSSYLHKMKINSKIAVSRSTNIHRQKEYTKEKLYRVSGERNASIPSAGSYISIVENPTKGRTLVFTQDLKAGTTVIVEDPYVIVLTDTLKFETSHCSKCFKKIMSVVPCNECVFATYCSRKCRRDDRNVHKYECPCLNYFHAIQLSPTGHLAFRAICKAGPESMYKLFQQTKDGVAYQVNDLPVGFNPETRIYESNDYFQVYNLIHHHQHSTIEYQNWLAFSLAKILQIRTNYFDGISTSTENLESFFNFIVAAIHQNLMSFPFNIFSLWAAPASHDPDLSEEDSDHPNLLSVYSVCSLPSHSCDPSCIRFNTKYGKMAIVTSRSVKAGEELTICYGSEYATCIKSIRQDKLEGDYHFICDCVACVYDWPLASDIFFEPDYLCPECGPKTSYNEIITCHTGLLYNQHLQIGTCETCWREYKMQDLIDEVEECFKRVDLAEDLIRLKNPLAALPIIVECVEFLQGRVLPPAVQLYDAQELLYTALGAISGSESYRIQQDATTPPFTS